LSGFTEAEGPEWPAVLIGRPDGTVTAATGLIAARASCAAGHWVAASRPEGSRRTAYGIYDVRSRVLVALAPDFEIRSFSPSCRFVAGYTPGGDLVLADTNKRTVRCRVSLGWHAARGALLFEDQDHLLIHRGWGRAVRISITGAAEIASTRPGTFSVLPSGS